jgi:hypothetical protein
MIDIPGTLPAAMFVITFGIPVTGKSGIGFWQYRRLVAKSRGREIPSLPE